MRLPGRHEFIFLSDSTAQVEALRGDKVDYLIYLRSEFVRCWKKINVEVYAVPQYHLRAADALRSRPGQ